MDLIIYTNKNEENVEYVDFCHAVKVCAENKAIK